MKAHEFLKTYGVDLLVVGSLALLSSAAAIYLAIPKGDNSHVAEIVAVLDSGTTSERIDLSLESETDERAVSVQGYHDVMILGVLKNKIHVQHSDCPNQYCVFQGWVSDADHPIVCAYNHLTITILGTASADVIVGNA
jgi:hypothetical protein